MERNNPDSRNRPLFGAAAAVLLIAAAGHAGPINADAPARHAPSDISIGAFRPSNPSELVRTRPVTQAADAQSRADDIPWTLLPVTDIDIPIASPDWRMMPKQFTRGKSGKLVIRRAQTLPALAALRGDEPVAPGSVFSSSFGVGSPETDPTEPRLDDDGKPVFAAPTKYFQDFEDGAVAREWRLAGLDNMEKFGRFAGPYRNSTQTLYVQCEPDTPYVVTFDLLFIAAQLGDPGASDKFSVEVDGQALLEDTFATLRERNEEFNKERDEFDPDIYKQVAVTFTPRGDGVVTIKFKSAAFGSPGGETWGLDNVHIDIAPKQTLGELEHADRNEIAALGAAGRLAGASGNPYPFDTETSYFRGDPNLRPPGARGPLLPPTPIPVPTPGATVLLLAGGWAAFRRSRR